MNFPKREEILAAAMILEDCPSKQEDIANWALDIYEKTDFSVSYGATKVIVYFNNTDWVIKAPIPGSFDYCRVEAENWIRAKREGVGYAFAPCFYYGRPYGTPIYIQRRIQKDLDEMVYQLYQYVSNKMPIGEDEDKEDYTDRLYAEIDTNLCDNDRIEIFFGSEGAQIVDFVCKYNINDLHEGNFGYLKDKLVIFDYSGFYRERKQL